MLRTQQSNLQLPTLYFSILMVGLLLDHMVFKARWSERTKWVVFFAYSGIIIGVFWWFRGVAFGIDGDIHEHKGLLWRKVRSLFHRLSSPRR